MLNTAKCDSLFLFMDTCIRMKILYKLHFINKSITFAHTHAHTHIYIYPIKWHTFCRYIKLENVPDIIFMINQFMTGLLNAVNRTNRLILVLLFVFCEFFTLTNETFFHNQLFMTTFYILLFMGCNHKLFHANQDTQFDHYICLLLSCFFFSLNHFIGATKIIYSVA